jgi:hypothetical protein
MAGDMTTLTEGVVTFDKANVALLKAASFPHAEMVIKGGSTVTWVDQGFSNLTITQKLSIHKGSKLTANHPLIIAGPGALILGLPNDVEEETPEETGGEGETGENGEQGEGGEDAGGGDPSPSGGSEGGDGHSENAESGGDGIPDPGEEVEEPNAGEESEAPNTDSGVIPRDNPTQFEFDWSDVDTDGLQYIGNLSIATDFNCFHETVSSWVWSRSQNQWANTPHYYSDNDFTYRSDQAGHSTRAGTLYRLATYNVTTKYSEMVDQSLYSVFGDPPANHISAAKVVGNAIRIYDAINGQGVLDDVPAGNLRAAQLGTQNNILYLMPVWEQEPI